MEQIISSNFQKYDIFYRDVKRFLITTNVVKEEGIEGFPPENLSLLEKQLGIKVPLSISKYFQYFGNKLIDRDGVFTKFPINNLKQAQIFAKEITPDVMAEISKIPNSITFFDEDKLRWSVWFCDNTIENPEPFFLLELCEVEPYNLFSFTNFMRHRIFLAIDHTMRHHNALKQQKHSLNPNGGVDLQNVTWADFYYNYHEFVLVKSGKSANFWHDHRKKFYKLIATEEAEGDFLYSIDEFEMKFIEYLKSKIEEDI
jgi:hypothetical protein